MPFLDVICLFWSYGFLHNDCAHSGSIKNLAIGVHAGKIVWIGSSLDQLQHDFKEKIDIGGDLITPGLIDCHTHLVYGGDRSTEYERRLQGVSYETIAREGGGIQKNRARYTCY